MKAHKYESNSVKIFGNMPTKRFWENVKGITYEFGKTTGKGDEDAKILAKQTVKNFKKTWPFFVKDED